MGCPWDCIQPPFHVVGDGLLRRAFPLDCMPSNSGVTRLSNSRLSMHIFYVLGENRDSVFRRTPHMNFLAELLRIRRQWWCNECLNALSLALCSQNPALDFQSLVSTTSVRSYCTVSLAFRCQRRRVSTSFRFLGFDGILLGLHPTSVAHAGEGRLASTRFPCRLHAVELRCDKAFQLEVADA